MKNKETSKPTKKQWALFIAGLIAVLTGVCILGFFVCRKLYRDNIRKKLMEENCVIEIADLDIKAPVLEGTDKDTLAKAAGHFTGTGSPGNGNYCIAGHSSTIYKEYFNNLKNVKSGMNVVLYDKEKNSYTYTVTGTMIVYPSDTWVLDDTGDNRVTIITCTDDGTQRLVVTGMLSQSSDAATYTQHNTD